MKKFVNILTLIIMVSVNFMTPFAYAQTDTQEVDFFQETENFDENNEENSDEIKTSDASGEDDENAEIEDSEDNSSDIEEKLEDFETAGGDELEANTGDNEQELEINTGDNEQEPEANTGDNEQEPEANTGNNEQEPEANTGDNEQEPGTNTGNNEQEPGTNTGNNEQEPEANTGGNEQEPEINTELWEQGEDFYDIIYTGIVRGREYTITFMDRNLGALTTDTQEEDSYGYYYQWGNSYPFSHHTQLNQYTTNQVDASGYGPDNRYRGENFIKGHGDWSSASNSNLWGGGLDSIENDYNDESDRQGPCPEGYHVPSVGEWHALFSCFLVNNGISEATTDGLEYPNYIGKERHAAYYLGSEDIEKFKSTFNISYAGRIKQDGSVDRTGEMTHFWTSTPMNNTALGFEVWDDRINLGGWETARSTGYPVRCFKSVEYELVDYTVTYLEDENEIIETKHWGDVLTEPEHTDKGEGYNRLGWYSRGVKFDFSTPITGDITLVATWGCADDYHIEDGLCKSNIKTVNCIETGGVENSTYIVTGTTITWDITGGVRNQTPTCEWKCLSDFHRIGNACISNTKVENCIETGGVENSTYIVTGVVIVWDITGGVRNEIPACEWKCNAHYHLSGDACVIDRFMFTLVDNSHINTSGSTQSGKKPYGSRVELNAVAYTGYRFLGWQIVGLEGSGASNTTVNSQVVFNMPDRDVMAIPLSEIIEYKIIYRNVDDAVVDNPTTYTIETPTFTLDEPIRTGYTFLGWTGSNGSDPELEVTITKGTTGNKRYTAVWEPKSGITYQVVHALEKANSTSYEEKETETLTGTTDQMTEAIAKEYTGFTAKEITQKIIKGDGSTVVRVQYQRNIYTITFDSNGGSEVLPITGKYESNITAPSNPTKKGYIFNGWKPSFPSTMPLSGAELVAQWRVRGGGGGSSSSEETQVTTGTNETTTGQTNTGKVEEIVEEVENLNIDAGTSIAPMVMRSMKLGSMMLMSVGPEIKATNTIECDSGYVLNQDGTGCELIQVTFDANGGEFEGGDGTEIVEPNLIEIYNKIYKYSHTQNVNDNGVQQYDYDEDWGNSNIRGTNRTSASSQAHVLTFPGVSSLTVDLYYNGESVNYDWVSVWKGNYPSYTASSNRTSAGYVMTADGAPNNNNRFGGSQNGTFTVNGNTLTKMGHSTLIIPGNAVTFGFTSDDDGCGYGYGYYAVVAGESNTVAGYQCGYDITAPTREGYFFDGWYTDTGYTQIFDTSASECLTANTTIYAKRYQPQPNDIILEATATEANQTLKINKYFANAYKVYRGDGNENLTSDTIHTYSKAGTYTIILSPAEGVDRWTFGSQTYPYSPKPLVPTSDTSMTGVKIVSMPSLEEGFGNSATNPGSYFFSYFNYSGALTSLPSGSFDTSKITSAGSNFFYYFNYKGALTSLPDNSFDTSNITSVGDNFFSYFNSYGQLISLPEGSFDTSKITSVGNNFFSFFNSQGALTSLPDNSFDTSNITSVGSNFFYYFNYKGALTSLPDNSFDTSNITSVGGNFFHSFNSYGQLTSLPDGSFNTENITSVGSDFFHSFNSYGQLTSLPDGSFNTENITSVGSDFFSAFNNNGALTSLPSGSFDTSKIMTVGDYFFSYFNGGGALTSLPSGSFDTSKITTVGNGFFRSFNQDGALESLPDNSFDISNITSVGRYFFYYFNLDGALESLPSGSFDTSKMMTVGDYFFSYFNGRGALESLPDNSFDISNITSVGRDFFTDFNRSGALTSLPEGSFRLASGLTSVGSYFFSQFNRSGALESLPSGSFDTSKITSVKDYFFYRFNKNGHITNLPDSFTMNSAGASNYIGYQDAFNSPNYTLNRNVSDLVSGITAPSSDRNTFSDNQPGRCGVADNWVVNTATECLIITFDTNGGSPNFGITIDPGFTIALPTATKVGHILSGWYTEQTGGTLVGVVGEMYTGISNTTLYAHWKACNPGFIPNADSTACICSPGHVLNTDGTGCVSVQITFDANGGIFSGGETEKVENTIFVELPSVRYSHTPNIDDEGNSNGNYGDNLEMLDVIKFTGSESLYVDLKYATETSYDYLVVLEGEYSGGEPNMPYHVFEGNSSYTLNTTGFYVDGDTVTFLFYSNGGGAYGGAYYGYYAIVEGIGASSENYRCEYDIIDPTREGYIFEGWYIDTGYTQIFDTSECLSSNTTVYAKWYQIHPKDIILEATATEPGQTLAINKYFANAYTVYRGDKEVEDIVSDATYYYTAPDAMHTYSKAGTYTIILSLTGGADRWTFRNVGKPLVPINRTTMTGVKIVSMPSLADGFGESTTAPGNYFFYNFNHGGALTSLPEGSFDTSNITSVGDYFFGFFNDNGALTSLGSGSFRLSTGLTTVGNYFFLKFNSQGALTSLPEGSFNTNNITTVGDSFFIYFNNEGQLTSLPKGSFDTSNITAVGNNFFEYFNQDGALISLPEGSFDTSNITSVGDYFFGFFNYNGALISLGSGSFRLSTGLTTVGDNFFRNFNYSGALTSLPEGSFNTENITTAGNSFFTNFNYSGALTSLSEGSFNTENITTAGNSFFRSFNYNGALISLGSGSFRLSTGLTTVGDAFFYSFNSHGALTSLPEGSFNTENITTAGNSFFTNFNGGGSLTSLPEGSFDTSNITTAGNSFFLGFNDDGGSLTSLPEGSFRLSTGLTTVGDAFFYYFNDRGLLTSLPEGSFDTSNITAVGNDFFREFNRYGALESLPEGSFDTSNITSVGDYFFRAFNYGGSLTSLPDSFKLNSLAYNKSSEYSNAFNSPSYTFNRNVSDIVSGVTVPSSDRNTFSDNQPGRCGVNANWLVNAATGCNATITFDTNGGDPVSSMVTNGKIILPEASKSGYILKGWYTEGGTMVGKAGDLYTGNSSITLNAEWNDNKVIILEATATEANQTLKINKYFANAYTVDRGDGSPVETVSADKTHTYSEPGTYTIVLSPAEGVDRWTFQNVYNPLVPTNGTTVADVKIAYMPSLEDGFGNSEINPGNYFFNHFNYYGKLTSLPEGSFDTSKITTVGDNFFSFFNNNGQLTRLPEGSFRLSTGLTTVGDYFFYYFNNNGQLTSLSEGSFDTSNITTVENSFFSYFNSNGQLTSLPSGSFDTSNITTVGSNFFIYFNGGGQLTRLPEGSFRLSTGLTTVGNSFFSYFNSNGQLTSLPSGSFDTSKITTVGSYFFYSFNYNGKLTSLPSGSFDTSKITVVGYYFFRDFNNNGQLTSLPEGSFKLSTGLTTVGDNFFYSFNSNGKLTSLPEGSFDTSNIATVGNSFFSYFNKNGQLTSLPSGSFDTSKITVVGYYFFRDFNSNGALTSLPSGSFDTSNITTVGDNFFYSFNSNGKLTSLPEGSFDTSNIATVGNSFFSYFNNNGQLTSLPDSFKLTSAAYNKTYAYKNAFKSSNYTINRKVSDLVAGIENLAGDQDVFSDNQPGRCGVHENWLVTTADACSISYDDGLGGTGEFKYTADTTGVVAGSGITLPTREGYAFGGWYTASGEKVDEVSFPELDGQTLHAKWNELYTITYNLNGGTESRTNPTTYTALSGTFGLYQPTKTGAMFLGWTGSNGNIINANVYITQGSTGNRTYNAVWGTYEDIDAYFISDTGAVSYITVMDRNLGANTDDITSTGSYGLKYQWGNNNGFADECWTNNCSDSVTANATTIKIVWNSGYDNSNYWGNTYVRSAGNPGDYWIDSVENNDNHSNLRGGGTDEVSNHWGLDIMSSSNIINKQGPCPDGYHVPSIGEWNNLLKYRVAAYTGEGNDLILNIGNASQLNSFSNNIARGEFQKDFKISMDGYRHYNDVKLKDQGSYTSLWTTSTARTSNFHYARYFRMTSNDVAANHSTIRGYAHPVRCFSNDYTFSQPSMNVVPNGGTGAMILVEGGDIKSLGTPKRGAHSIFEGWYDADSGGNRIQTGSTAPSNLYARWDCDTGYLQNLSGTACELGNVVTFDANRGTFVANQIILSGQKVTTPADPQLPGYTFGGWYTNTGLTTSFNFSTPITGDITLYAKWTYNFTITDLNVYFVESDGSIEHGIIMDRNLGATAIYNGNYSNPNTTSYGYYFQWGNNYGFANAGSVSDQSAKIPFNVWSAYIPSKYAKNIFVKGNNSWMNESTPTDNLWGGESSDVFDRQGPCPDGYHIPTSGEWLNLYNYRDNAKTLTLSLGYQWASDFLMPLAGLRGYSRAQLEDQKYDGYYWAANASSVDYAYHFGFYSSLITPNREYSRANGTSVRCFKNNQTSVMNIYPDGGTGAIITFTGKIVKLGIPERVGYFFDGWYSTSGFAAGSEVDIGDDVPVNLYAKWLEYFQEYQVDFLANGGEFSDGTSSQTRLYVYNSGTNSYVISGYLSLPNRTGYMFDGWYTDTGYTTERMGTNEEIMLGSIHTLYAKWLPFNDLAIDFGDNVIYIMDRNLGANDIASGTNPYYQSEDVTKLGKYYQWGNNFGFGNLGNLFEVDDKRVNVDEYNVNNKSYYDTTFHTSSISPYSRTLNNNTNLWGGDMMVNTENEQEYKQGPCPIGYHVPDIREWTALSDLYEEWRLSEAGQSFCNNKGYGECFTTKLKLPNAGYRDHGNSTLSNVGNIGFYRSVSPYGDGGFYSYSLGLDKSRLDPTLDTPRALGLSVRCMKNSDDVTIMFNSMGGSEVASLTQKWYIPMLGDISPTRANSEFDGWYLNTGYQNQFIGYTTTNKTLYAKRKCDFGYIQNSDQTACEPIAVNFDANGGNFSGGQEIISVMPGIDTGSILVTKYSHTPNISDDGTQNGNYENSISTNEVITITGADTLHVTITYATESTSYDWAVVRAGSYPDYTAYSNYGASVSGKLGGTAKTTVEYDIPGDSVTFGFRSDSSVNNYGYYAVITGTGSTSSIVYSGNAFINVEEPTRIGYTFTGWYLDTGYQNQFDLSNISTGAVTNVYARWISNEYTITYNLNGGTESLPNPTTYTVESGMFGLYQPTKIGYMFLGWTGSNENEPNANIYIPKGSTGDRTYNAVWGDFEDIDIYSISNTGVVSYITLMDRNMGANSDDITSTGSYGFHYQRGNNNGFQIGCGSWMSCSNSDNVAVNATTTKAIWNPIYENKGYNGTRFIKGNNTDYWEGNKYHDGLRGGSSDKANNNYGLDNLTSNNIVNRQGPCPTGYHVPSAKEWENVYKILGLSNDVLSADKMRNLLNLPFAWRRSPVDGIVYTPPTVMYGGYWSSTPYNPGVAYFLYVNSTSINVYYNTYGRHTEARSVRCFSNDYMFTSPSMTIHPNGGTGAMILVEGDTIKSLGTPKRANSKFEGWYSNTAFTTSIITGDTAPDNLYAKWSCDVGYVQNVAGDGCTKLYTITYNLNGGTETVANPTSYTVESGSFGLYQPTKIGYTFLGWTGSNGSTPQSGVVIPSGSTGDRIYNAVWQANTNTPYTVYHYVKKVGSGTYELAQTEPKQGTSDAILVLSSLAKADGFVCATYDRGSLTGTESGPGEIVTQTIINSDGSTEIYLYYNRNKRKVYLSGDEYVDYLEINGIRDDEAERECGSEVPVNAIPKPGYHFVRWDREEREGREDDEVDTHSGGTND